MDGSRHVSLLNSAQTFAALVLAAFDLHRRQLYEALHWPEPTESGAAEVAAGRALTRFIQRGMQDRPVKYSS